MLLNKVHGGSEKVTIDGEKVKEKLTLKTVNCTHFFNPYTEEQQLNLSVYDSLTKKIFGYNTSTSKCQVWDEKEWKSHSIPFTPIKTCDGENELWLITNNSLYKCNTTDNSYTKVIDLPKPSGGVTVSGLARLGSNVFYINGYDTFKYDSVSNTWTQTRSLPSATGNSEIVLARPRNSSIYIMGGTSSASKDRITRFDTVRNTATTIKTSNLVMDNSTVVGIKNDVFFGIVENYALSKLDLYRYNITTSSWEKQDTYIPHFAVSRRYFSTLISDGTSLIALALNSNSAKANYNANLKIDQQLYQKESEI